MGALVTRLIGGPATVLLVGLDGAGKSLILRRIRTAQVVAGGGGGSDSPTAAEGNNGGGILPAPSSSPSSSATTAVYDERMTLTKWHAGGDARARRLQPLYVHHCDYAQAVIFVCDSADRGEERVAECVAALRDVLAADVARPEVPVLVLANKQDLAGAMSVAEVEKLLGVEALRGAGRTIVARGCSAATGVGLGEALDLLADLLRPASQGR